jgi:hypothetical protein
MPLNFYQLLIVNINAVKIWKAVNVYRLTPLNFDLTMPSYAKDDFSRHFHKN